MTIFITSDHHFLHKGILKHRPLFSTVEEQTDIIVRNWKKMIQPDDTVYLLGDISMGAWREALVIISALPGVKNLVVGNHDRCSPAMPNGHNYVRPYYAVFESVVQSLAINHKGMKIAMSHYPYSGDHTDEDRHAMWRLTDTGVPLVHGHTHSTEKFSLSTKGTPQVNVSLEAWDYHPAPLSEVHSLLLAS